MILNQVLRLSISGVMRACPCTFDRASLLPAGRLAWLPLPLILSLLNGAFAECRFRVPTDVDAKPVVVRNFAVVQLHPEERVLQVAHRARGQRPLAHPASARALLPLELRRSRLAQAHAHAADVVRCVSLDRLLHHLLAAPARVVVLPQPLPGEGHRPLGREDVPKAVAAHQHKLVVRLHQVDVDVWVCYEGPGGAVGLALELVDMPVSDRPGDRQLPVQETLAVDEAARVLYPLPLAEERGLLVL
mmetsp:Transcript_1515/g.3404  ORF Transcript_1515/g.3404 Transcript_1515/m.3404 type:complete len:246 (-) Transcript_1515:670-1407(-)